MDRARQPLQDTPPMLPHAQSLRIEIREHDQQVSALLQRANGDRALLVFAHGAGAGMQHAFMASMSDELATRGIATLRYQFPYMEQGRRAPSPRPLLLATVRAAVARARALAGELPLYAGGKSMGGRMTSLAAAQEEGIPGLRGIVFFGFPLHATGKTSSERADHLKDVESPLLFLQGTRDKLAELSRIKRVCDGLGSSATLHVVEGADHAFHVLKRSGRSDAEVRSQLADTVAGFVDRRAG